MVETPVEGHGDVENAEVKTSEKNHDEVETPAEDNPEKAARSSDQPKDVKGQKGTAEAQRD